MLDAVIGCSLIIIPYLLSFSSFVHFSDASCKSESKNKLYLQNTGWWTYELCYNKHVQQFRLEGKN